MWQFVLWRIRNMSTFTNIRRKVRSVKQHVSGRRGCYCSREINVCPAPVFAAASCTGTVPTPANPALDAPVAADCTLSNVVTEAWRGLEPSVVCGEVTLVPLLY
jgi:hypothetical protein